MRIKFDKQLLIYLLYGQACYWFGFWIGGWPH